MDQKLTKVKRVKAPRHQMPNMQIAAPHVSAQFDTTPIAEVLSEMSTILTQLAKQQEAILKTMEKQNQVNKYSIIADEMKQKIKIIHDSQIEYYKNPNYFIKYNPPSIY